MRKEFDLLAVGSMVSDVIKGEKFWGGCAPNVAVATYFLGSEVALYTASSDTNEAREYENYLKKMGIDVFIFSQLLEDLPCCSVTTEGIKWIDNGLTEQYEQSPVSKNVLSSAGLVYLGMCESSFSLRVIEQLNNEQVLAVNPGSWVYQNPQGLSEINARANYLFLNEKEYHHLLTNGYLLNMSDTEQKPGQVLVVTRGKNSTIIKKNALVHEIPVIPVEVIDETGAGDAFAAGFLWAEKNGLEISQSGELGNRLASLIVQQQNPQATADLVRQFFRAAQL
ncbi:MAG TPA: PfkB family carbohydrate kinase [Vitreimonas sp.]|nr:PfkB family carbohydrate kinase [Vitreimonas sp.]